MPSTAAKMSFAHRNVEHVRTFESARGFSPQACTPYLVAVDALQLQYSTNMLDGHRGSFPGNPPPPDIDQYFPLQSRSHLAHLLHPDDTHFSTM